jgi:predicted nuclease of predicted toxin-antitoxin system
MKMLLMISPVQSDRVFFAAAARRPPQIRVLTNRNGTTHSQQHLLKRTLRIPFRRYMVSRPAVEIFFNAKYAKRNFRRWVLRHE